MASAPPPYSEQPTVYPANPPVNPSFAAAGYQQSPGFVDPSKGAQAGYPAQPGYPPQQPQPGYPPAQYPAQQMQPAMAPQPQQQTIVIQQGPVATGNCPVCRVCCFSSLLFMLPVSCQGSHTSLNFFLSNFKALKVLEIRVDS